MDSQNPNAPTPTKSRIPGKSHPRPRPNCGVIHDNIRHTEEFVVVGNHLSQHHHLSLVAIGLATHIQSLREGTEVDIKSLAKRFPEGRTTIAAGLRELETYGYLRRVRERTPSGRFITRTISCNKPGHRGPALSDKPPARRGAPTKPPPRKSLPAVPKPSLTSADLLQTAIGVLAGLRREDPRLLLSQTDVEHLAPGVVAWLERDITPPDMTKALTEGLPPTPLTRPAALLAHRLAAKLPPLPPFRPAPEPRHPFQTCDGCERAFRAPEPGLCRDCRTDPKDAL
ncbi:helix-turn-helix domain-containing protein [Streptomyces sp. NPDC003832]